MTPVLENAVLSTNLDCQNYDLKNVGMLEPVPDGMVSIYDERLDGPRAMVAGSVTNDSVNASAAIDQSKLNLNLGIPTDWIEAEGNLTELVSRKGAPNGYAGLDTEGKIDTAHFTPPTIPASGSITSIGITIRPTSVPEALSVHPAQITSTGTFTFQWVHPTQPYFFGSDGTLDFQHHEFIYPFFVPQQFNLNLFNLDASKFTSGVFDRRRFAVAKPLGPLHAPGMVPDTGASGAGNMYLGRDMHWHHFVVNDPAVAHQPTVPDVDITLDWWETHKPTTPDPSLVKAHITIRSNLRGSFLFYRVTHQGDMPDEFQEAHHDDTPDDPHITLEVNEFDFIEAYGARQGYTDSAIMEWTVFTPISDLTPDPLP